MLHLARLTCLASALACTTVFAEQAPPPKPKDDPPQHMTQTARLALIRFVSGEFARAVRPLPSGKKGFRFRVGRPVNEAAIRQGVASAGSAGNPGDTVQITRLEFKTNEIVVDINGGGTRRKSWRERVQISGGMGPAITTSQSGTAQGYQGIGSTLILDYGGPLPNLTPDELKADLSQFLDFTRQRSASVQWVETLAPEFQDAIRAKRAIVGMDREMVVAAIGRPGDKVRMKDPDGLETEDWIYGHPPAQTIFVTFAGDKVIRVKQFPQ